MLTIFLNYKSVYKLLPNDSIIRILNILKVSAWPKSIVNNSPNVLSLFIIRVYLKIILLSRVVFLIFVSSELLISIFLSFSKFPCLRSFWKSLFLNKEIHSIKSFVILSKTSSFFLLKVQLFFFYFKNSRHRFNVYFKFLILCLQSFRKSLVVLKVSSKSADFSIEKVKFIFMVIFSLL